jgi:hypothetical protein
MKNIEGECQMHYHAHYLFLKSFSCCEDARNGKARKERRDREDRKPPNNCDFAFLPRWVNS